MKWNKVFSSDHTVKGGGPQGGTAAGILEYISQAVGNLSPLSESETFKFIDDASFTEVLNLTLAGLSSSHSKTQVPSEMCIDKFFLPTKNTNSQNIFNKISQWTDEREMKLNPSKTNYMIINFCKSAQFSTRLYLENSLIEQMKEIKLLGVIISEDLSWQANTDMIKKLTRECAYQESCMNSKSNYMTLSRYRHYISGQ